MPKITRHGGPSNSTGVDARTTDVEPTPQERLSNLLSGGEVRNLHLLLTYAVAIGALKGGTAQSYKTSVDAVLAEVDQHDTDVRELDIESWCEIFAKSRGRDLQSVTVSSYQSRFRRSVELYRHWLDDPENFRGPPPRDRRSVRQVFLSNSDVDVVPALGGLQFRNVNDEIMADLQETGPEGVVPYKVPIDERLKAYLLLPYPLTRGHAEKLSQVLYSLALDLPATDPPAEECVERREVRKKAPSEHAPRQHPKGDVG